MNKSSDESATRRDGTPTIHPYFTKSRYENFTSYFFKMDNHIIPASAPRGDRNAPIFDPIIEEYIALNRMFSQEKLQIEEYKTDIGMLLIRFAENAEVRP